MKTDLQSLIRVASYAAAAWALTGSAAFAQGSEFDSLNSDPLEAMFGDDEDVNMV